MIILIDNYDSFTYNLYQYLGQMHENVIVARNDCITLEEIEAYSPDAIVISPGPGYPADAGISVDVIRKFSGIIPILGVCLGHQAIAEAFGGKIIHAKNAIHGKLSEVNINNNVPIFHELQNQISVGRYHSLVVDSINLPTCLSIIGTDSDSQIMAVKHKSHKTYGVQFHPESILTQSGKKILANFLTKVAGIKIIEINAPGVPAEKRHVLKKYIYKVIEGENLTEDEAYAAMDCIMTDHATSCQIASFVTALRMKGETISEITGFARVMRDKADVVKTEFSAIDIVGTGGDLANSFNISTTASFVIAGANVRVAKHGNRSVSSKSGAADVLEKLGVNINLNPNQASRCLEKCGISFLFAPCFHGSMKFAALPRREIGLRSVFNILGPLSNPALTDYILLGVYDENLMETLAKTLINLGIKGAMIVHGDDGLDEISISSTTSCCEIRDKKIIKYQISPRDFGLKLWKKSDIIGGTPQENAEITLNVLRGVPGAALDIVLINAGCALYISGACDSILEGIEMARTSIESGAAMEKLNMLKDLTRTFEVVKQ